MTATVSNSSYMSQTQTATTATTGPSPYGTRSRHKPDSSRPNYAEDVEMDFEVPIPHTTNNTQNNAAMPITTSRKISIASESKASHRAVENDNAAPLRGGSRRSISGRATSPSTSLSAKGTATSGPGIFSTGGTQPSTNSKKRKAPNGHDRTGSNGHGNSHSASSHATATMTRRSSAIATASRRETNMMTFEKSRAMLKNGKLEADNGTSLSINDHVYLVCEPPGDPYYLCRIMEFIHRDGDNSRASPIESMRVNWYYRPRDVLRYNNDTRLVYGTMHSDVCPITSLRGKCQVLHRSEIPDLDEYRKSKDCFWFNQIFDRFIHRWYEVIPTSQIINVPEKVKRALDERWKYVVVETSRVKELTSAVKMCKRCSGYCPTTESVECAVCRSTYHMNCVRPPLLKKPSRGFAWACGPCNRAQERKLEARHTALISEAAAIEAEDEEVVDEEEEDPATTANTTAPSPSGADAQLDLHPATHAEIALAKMWPMRYLGIHCRVEDALQYDDRAIYPRASSRLGARHQAIVHSWCGRPVEYVKPVEIKRRYAKHPTHKKDGKLTKETIAALEADRAEKAKRPIWVQDEPPGYVRRGEDLDNSDPNVTARLLFKMPDEGSASDVRHSTRSSVRDEESVDTYMERAKGLAKTIGVKSFSTNFLDMALKLLVDNAYDAEAALRQLKKVDRRKDLHEPELTKEELKRFEEGVAKYGSELRIVRQHVKTLSHADAVRFYYMWKKTQRGQEIWGAYGGRKSTKKRAEADAAYRLPDDVADDYDDSAFDNDKAMEKKRGFQCKFCSSKKSRQWRRAPGVAPGQTVSVTADGKVSSSSGNKDKSNQLVLALCQRCAGLWRKYAIKWENVDEVIKKAAQGGGKTWRKRIDEAYLQELQAANDVVSKGADDFDTVTGGDGVNGSGGNSFSEKATASAEPARKKSKTSASVTVNGTISTSHGKETGGLSTAAENIPKKKEKPPPKPVDPSPPPPPPPPPLPLTQPKLRQLPCAICRSLDNQGGDKLFTCKHCRLSVHKDCYGIDGHRGSSKWLCDMCLNDRAPQVSMDYKCVLCPVSSRHYDLLEPLKQSKHKKTEREREKDRGERELASHFLKNYALSQKEKGWPEMPREALKKTANNNWVHVTCAVWTQEVRFSNASALEVAEGIARGPIPSQRFDLTCKFCNTMQGICVSCPICHDNFHIGCAHLAGCTFGFDITPVKSSRRDHVNIVTLGQETGYMTAAVWCKDHQVKTIVHTLTETTELDGKEMNTLQLFAQTYKQADLTFAGTMRKANLVSLFTKTAAAAVAASVVAGNSPTTSTNPASLNSTTPNNRRISAAPQTGSGTKGQRASAGGEESGNDRNRTHLPPTPLDRRCYKCMIDVSPKWWKVDNSVRIDRLQGEFGGIRSNTMQVNGDVALPFDSGPVKSVSSLRPREDLDANENGDHAQLWQCHKCHWKVKHQPDVMDEFAAQSRATVGQQQIHVSGWPAYQRPELVNGIGGTVPADTTTIRKRNSIGGDVTGGSNRYPISKPVPTPLPQLAMHHDLSGPSFYSQEHRNGFQRHQRYHHSTQTRPTSGAMSPPLTLPLSRHSLQTTDSQPISQSVLGRPIYASRQPPPSPLLPTTTSSPSSASIYSRQPPLQTSPTTPSFATAAKRDANIGSAYASTFTSSKANTNGLRSPIEANSRAFNGKTLQRQPQSPARPTPQMSPGYQHSQHVANLPPSETSFRPPSLPATPQQQEQHFPRRPTSSHKESYTSHERHRQSNSISQVYGNSGGSYDGQSRKAYSMSSTDAMTSAAQGVTQKHPSTPKEVNATAGIAAAAPPPSSVATSTTARLSSTPTITPGKADVRPGTGVGGASASPSLKNLLH